MTEPNGTDFTPTMRPITTYSLEEVAAMVLPPDMANPTRWLTDRLRRGDLSGYKVGRWRMTHSDVEDLIARHRNTPRQQVAPRPADPEDPAGLLRGGLSERSYRRRQRYAAK